MFRFRHAAASRRPLDGVRCRRRTVGLHANPRPKLASGLLWTNQFGGVHSYKAQAPPCHRTHLRTARRVWRMVVLATHTPLTSVLPGPQPTATCVIMLPARAAPEPPLSYRLCFYWQRSIEPLSALTRVPGVQAMLLRAA
jgi:hypothetical protein